MSADIIYSLDVQFSINKRSGCQNTFFMLSYRSQNIGSNACNVSLIMNIIIIVSKAITEAQTQCQIAVIATMQSETAQLMITH